MTVNEVMTSNVRACSPSATLGTAATIMWECDCGVVPVATDDGRVVGVITDRDVSIAAATRAASPSTIQVRDAMSGRVHTCEATDDVHLCVANDEGAAGCGVSPSSTPGRGSWGFSR